MCVRFFARIKLSSFRFIFYNFVWNANIIPQAICFSYIQYTHTYIWVLLHRNRSILYTLCDRLNFTADKINVEEVSLHALVLFNSIFINAISIDFVFKKKKNYIYCLCTKSRRSKEKKRINIARLIHYWVSNTTHRRHYYFHTDIRVKHFE